MLILSGQIHVKNQYVVHIDKTKFCSKCLKIINQRKPLTLCEPIQADPLTSYFTTTCSLLIIEQKKIHTKCVYAMT